MLPDRKPSTRPLLWLALLVTLGLVNWQWSQEDGADIAETAADKSVSHATPSHITDSQPQPPGSQEPAVAAVIETPSVEATTYFTRELPTQKVSHVLFAAHEWLPPPPKPQPPPPPEAPPLPYSYVGSMQDVPGGDTVILMQQKKVLLPKLGSRINAQWRLDKEDAQAVYFTYLPLNKPAVLSKTKTAAASQRQVNAEAENNYPEEILNQ